MSKPTVYIETSVVSYLTSRQNSDLIVAAHQKATQNWWQGRSNDFELRISEFVLAEARAGNPDAAQRRLFALSGIPTLELIPEVEILASAYWTMAQFP